MTTVPMHDMGWTEIIKDNPEWVGRVAHPTEERQFLAATQRKAA